MSTKMCMFYSLNYMNTDLPVWRRYCSLLRSDWLSCCRGWTVAPASSCHTQCCPWWRPLGDAGQWSLFLLLGSLWASEDDLLGSGWCGWGKRERKKSSLVWVKTKLIGVYVYVQVQVYTCGGRGVEVKGLNLHFPPLIYGENHYYIIYDDLMITS